MASLVRKALEAAQFAGSSPKGRYWAFRHPNQDAPPQTYRLARRAGNGWTLLLAASKATGQVLSFYVESDEDQQAVREALQWLGIRGEIVPGEEVTLRLASGASIPSQLVGGEKPKKKGA
ncbi:hypothetical protein J2Z79_003277 [Symbiobacterium terraclitae]|jgi:hypothetical protein|uniref:Uncharacterized protein n=1 Tax=Symbiobacterium terraclitae TaxID=557451 RepID=A0ABS4JWC3_9FIRM|nr:hypothetical protein [Symbiobacterium terraclitae]MBP2019835.1 hypothetical protein [Symbiobacterium terraclitae]